MRIPPELQAKLDALPDAPGCYLMRDRQGHIIYVGKAVSLRKRVKYYFRQATLRSADPKLRGLIKSVADIECMVARSEAEAVLTEGRLIKEYRPRYNVSFRDDKRFLLLGIDLEQPFPRFELGRIQKSSRKQYFGPYASAAAAREALRFVEKRFGLRSCKPAMPAAHDHEHCIDDIVRYCTAPCIGKITEQDYMERVAEACAFLRGERPGYLVEIKAEMREAAVSLDFERAGALRDALLRLGEITKNRARMLSTPAMKREDGKAGIAALKAALGLRKLPRVMEAYDISNISGTYAVAGLVCAVDGMPRKNRYRRFRIKTVAGADDPAMMGEVVARDYSRRLLENRRVADLILVDGGTAQLGAACAALERLGLKLPVVGLAKRFEELYLPGTRYPVRLRRDSAALKVLQRLRDEAHRFALDYHRTVRDRRVRESALDDIPGIGPVRKQRLLKAFGSMRRLEKATEEEIVRVPGIGPELARVILGEKAQRKDLNRR